MRLDTEGEPPCGPVAAPDSLVLGPRPARKGWGSRFEGLLGLTAGKAVEIRWHKRDRYGRVVGQVWVVSPDARCQGAGCPKTLDAGLAQVTVGLAWHYKRYAGEQSCQGSLNFPQLWSSKSPHPRLLGQLMGVGSSARTSPALSFSLSR